MYKIRKFSLVVSFFLCLISVFSANAGTDPLSNPFANNGYFVESPQSTSGNPIYLYRMSHGFVVFEKGKVTYQFIDKKSNRTQDLRELAFGSEDLTITNIVSNWQGSSNKQTLVPGDFMDSYSSYMIGNSPDNWKLDRHHFTKLLYKNIYDNIDLEYSLANSQLKYNLIIHPGANPEDVKIFFRGSDGGITSDDSSYRVESGNHSVVDKLPIAYQLINGITNVVPVTFMLKNDQIIQFEANDYDRSIDLIIDPFLYFSTFVGGSDNDAVYVGGIDRDNLGNIFLTGRTASTNFPTTAGVFQVNNAGNLDAFVLKLNSSGNSLVYCTYVGGSNLDAGYSLKLDQSNGSLWVVGGTYSANFPTTAGCWQSVFGGSSDACIFHLNAAGNGLIKSTYFGQGVADYGHGIDLDSNDNVYITGETNGNFYTTGSCFQGSYGGGSWDGIIAKFPPSLNAPIYSTYIGGNLEDVPLTIRVDGFGNSVIAGWTAGSTFPIIAGSFDVTYNGGAFDAFVTKINSTGSALLYSTYIGSSGLDRIWNALYLDPNGRAVVAGYGSLGLPTTAGAYNITYSGGTSDVFISILNAAGTNLDASCLLGGINGDLAYGLSADVSGNIFVTGVSTVGFPYTTCTYDSTFNGGTNDAFVSVLSPDLSSLLFSSYLGGNDNDNGFCIYGYPGHVICAGETFSPNFPTTAAAFDPSFNGSSDIYMTDIDLTGNVPPVAMFATNNTQFCIGENVVFTNQTSAGNSYLWNFGDGTTSVLQDPTHNYLASGVYQVMLIAYGGNCATNDTIVDTLTINPSPLAAFNYQASCTGAVTFISTSGASLSSWDFNGQGNSTGDTVQFNFMNPVQGTPVTLIVSNGGTCADTLVQNINFPLAATASFTIPDSSCGLTINPQNNSSATIYNWNFGDGNSSSLASPTHTYNLSGTYTVTLIADTALCADTVNQQITLIDQPQAICSFTSDCSLGISINNQSTSVTGYNWNWGDGTTSTGLQSNYTYAAVGPYLVTLIVNNSAYCFDTLQQNITTNQTPVTNFTYPSTLCQGNVQFTANGTSANQYAWSFGDGGTSVLASPNYLYTSAGVYTVTMIASNGICADTNSVLLTINPIPVALFTDSSGCDLLHFLDPVGLNTSQNSFQWYFGDGDSSILSNNQHLYNAAGTYNVALIVTNSAGCTDTVIQPINARVKADAVFIPTVPACGLQVVFTNNSTNSISSLWNFGDGNISSLNQPTYSYINGGNYTITLIADTGICSDSASATIVLNENPTANFTVSGGCNDTLLFQNGSSGAIGYTWHFGDGDSSLLSDPEHVYAGPGNYQVLLIASSGAGCTDTTGQLVSVNNSQPPSILVSIDSCNQSAYFLAVADSGLPMIWLFGDGTFSYGPSVSHEYTDTGTFQVMLIQEPNTACADSAFATIDIVPGETTPIFIPNCFTPNNDLINDWFRITRVSTCATYRMEIFNRWGMKILDTYDVEKGWDGNYNGQISPEGIYVYLISGSISKTGLVTLLR